MVLVRVRFDAVVPTVVSSWRLAVPSGGKSFLSPVSGSCGNWLTLLGLGVVVAPVKSLDGGI